MILILAFLLVSLCNGYAVPAGHKLYTAQDDARKAYGLLPLVIDPELSKLGDTWTSQCSWANPPSTWKTNTATAYAQVKGKTYNANDYSQTIGFNRAAASEGGTTASWLDNKVYWNCLSNACSAPTGKSCGGWTQTIWRKSERIGCSTTLCKTGSPFGSSFPTWENTICIYSPAGNFNGEHPLGTDTSVCSKVSQLHESTTIERTRDIDDSENVEKDATSGGTQSSWNPEVMSGIVIAGVVGVAIMVTMIVVIIRKRNTAQVDKNRGF
jgi:hypothetical protein